MHKFLFVTLILALVSCGKASDDAKDVKEAPEAELGTGTPDGTEDATDDQGDDDQGDDDQGDDDQGDDDQGDDDQGDDDQGDDDQGDDDQGDDDQGGDENPVDEQFELGVQLYTQKCSGCHGQLDKSAKRGKTADDIKGAIQDVALMNERFGDLTNEQIDAIVLALKNN